MDESRFFCKTIPALSAGVFLISAVMVFSLKYTRAGVVLLPFFDADETINRYLFYINFYIPFGVYSLTLYGCLFCSNRYFRFLFLVIALTAEVIAGYVLSDLFTINLCLYSASVIVIAAAFTPPKNFIISGISLLFLASFLFHPGFLGFAPGRLIFFQPETSQMILFTLYLVTLAAGASAIRLLTEKHLNSKATISHLNLVGTKMLLFNHRLQEYVKNSGEEAVKKDRLRFTSDLHDSCGYVFTNIIAITDAVLSYGHVETWKMQETFQLIQNQAREGLQRTREILHMIRELQNPVSGSIDTIYRMKAIFEEVTGISVEVESGNMQYDYGPRVNTVLTRIVQEAFTNSVRHGQASRILIHFWEFPGTLTMTVSDNGIGAQSIVKGIGLAGMEERLVVVGGTMEVSSPEDGGFRLRVEIPLVSAEAPPPEEGLGVSAPAAAPVPGTGG